jgi:hypothetical protein
VVTTYTALSQAGGIAKHKKIKYTCSATLDSLKETEPNFGVCVISVVSNTMPFQT